MSTVADITADLKALYAEKNCGPIMIRLSWHDAGVYSTGAKTGGCPNAAMRFTDGGEGCFGANAGESIHVSESKSGMYRYIFPVLPTCS
jgi:hypothetical protein